MKEKYGNSALFDTQSFVKKSNDSVEFFFVKEKNLVCHWDLSHVVRSFYLETWK